MTQRSSRSFLQIGAVAMLSATAWAQSDARLRGLCEEYWDAAMERSPTRATALGDYRYNDRLDDLSDEGRQRWRATLERLLAALRESPEPTLNGEDRLTRQLLERTLRDEILHMELHDEATPLEPLHGPHLQFPLLLVSHPFRDAADFRTYVARLRAFPRQVTQIINNLRWGVKAGWVSPRVLVEKVIPQLRTHIVADPKDSEFYRPLARIESLSEADRQAITAEVVDAIRGDVVPAYLKLVAYVEDEYLHACRATVGLSALPKGDKLYAARAYLNATVDVRPDELHDLGLSEVARIRGEMAKVQTEVGFEGTLDDFLAHMRTDPRHRFTSGAELYAAADAILQRTKPLMPRLFGRVPKADCVMKEIESFRAANSPVAYYNAPPEDGSRPGYYYINTYAPEERLRFTLEALTYHEAIPGHHFQMALDQENKNLPKFRRYASFTAYVEGWALYTEKLGYDIGGYADPLSRFGQLTFEMWRACRLVVDTGMHAKGWTRQQAIDFMAQNTSLALIDIQAEVDRYIAWPGQALAYKVGELRILRLRREAEAKLGPKFDLRAFHDALLSGGAMPIDILEQRMQAWIEKQAR
ncbi:MAG: DUF885 domain-containing protein [Planctomycetes bacterium]|nr:DUF885 domain-containing protein [Planctomycetota bacterium]